MRTKEQVIEVIDRVTAQPDVQAGFPDANGNTNVTWCNRALDRMLFQLQGNNVKLLNDRGINWTNANSMVQNARRNLTKVEPADAQAKANGGELIIACWLNPRGGSGHVALVCPTDRPTPTIGDIWIGQAGRVNGQMSLSRGFTAENVSQVEFYEVPFTR